ncbi:OPT oligopeptide transporter protein-domain-containing protein [Russula aff. rugulosa BPL654]|nr:OPT oligopeptide transporter protein-domain-containing protein [Russula aff. rugulosa BPL654]
MCITLSLADEEKRTTEVDNPTTDHQSDAMDVTVDDNDDPNFDPTAPVLEDESPYPEVRAAVANTDDPTMPASTLRAWIIGLIWAVLIPGVNQLFHFRYPSIIVGYGGVSGQFVPMLCSLQICKAWARYMPNISFFGIPLNPGPFTIKEHVIISIMAGIGGTPAYAVSVAPTWQIMSRFFYQWLLVMSTQLIGFSIAGIFKRFVVAPPSMIWPLTLVTTMLFNTLHGQETSGTHACGGISRLRFFYYVFIGYIITVSSFCLGNLLLCYDFLPSYLFTALSNFSWACWIAPNNAKVNQLFGVSHGLAMGILTFDWGQISFVNDLFHPLYTNVWYIAYLPLVSSIRFPFNLEAYKAYSPIFLPASFAICYGLSFAPLPPPFTYFPLLSKYIWTHARRPLSQQPDIHARLMSVYKEVPDWWYLTIFVTMFVFGVVVIEVWKTDLSVWGFILALLISFVYTLPFNLGLNVITELIIGYALPDRPIAMMLFKTWGYITMLQAIAFITNLKLAHYMKIAHRPMFFCQSMDVLQYRGSLRCDQKDGFTCPGTTVFGNASIIWGVIGPRRLFSHGQLYYGLIFFFLVGILAPLFQWILHKNTSISQSHSATRPACPCDPLNYVPMVFVCFIFNYIIRRRNFDWWAKYNYLLSAGLNAGYTIGLLIIFFTLQYPKNGTIGLDSIQKWWGNTVYMKTADYKGVPFKSLPEGGKFGPSSW